MPQLWADSLVEHRRLVFERILDAYVALRATRDLDEITMAAVAAEAGIARSAIYNYVEDKHGLVLAHAERTFAEATARLARAVARENEPLDQLVAYARATLRGYRREPAAGDELMGRLSPAEQQRLLATLAPMRDLLGSIVERGVAAGAFAGPADDVVAVVWACLGGLRLPVATGRLGVRRAERAVERLLTAGVVAGAAAPPPPPSRKSPPSRTGTGRQPRAGSHT